MFLINIVPDFSTPRSLTDIHHWPSLSHIDYIKMSQSFVPQMKIPKKKASGSWHPQVHEVEWVETVGRRGNKIMVERDVPPPSSSPQPSTPQKTPHSVRSTASPLKRAWVASPEPMDMDQLEHSPPPTMVHPHLHFYKSFPSKFNGWLKFRPGV